MGQPFILDALDNKAPLSNSERASLDYKQLPQDVRAGDTLLLADGLIQLTVTKVDGDAVHTVVIHGGELSNNRASTSSAAASPPSADAKDLADIKTAVDIDVDYLAVSFPKSAADMQTAHRTARRQAAKAKLIAKSSAGQSCRRRSTKSSRSATASWWLATSPSVGTRRFPRCRSA